MSKQQDRNSGVLPVFFHLRSIAKIALSIGVLAAIALLAELFFITDSSGTGYAKVILSHSLTRENLGPAITVFGLVMTVLASFIAWAVALYGSFRVAGPLYRFSQNMKNIIEHPANKPVPIRSGDMLQSEWQEFEASHARLDEHYRRLGEALGDIKQTLPHDAESDLGAVHDTMKQFEEVERLVQL